MGMKNYEERRYLYGEIRRERRERKGGGRKGRGGKEEEGRGEQEGERERKGGERGVFLTLSSGGMAFGWRIDEMAARNVLSIFLCGCAASNPPIFHWLLTVLTYTHSLHKLLCDIPACTNTHQHTLLNHTNEATHHE